MSPPTPSQPSPSRALHSVTPAAAPAATMHSRGTPRRAVPHRVGLTWPQAGAAPGAMRYVLGGGGTLGVTRGRWQDGGHWSCPPTPGEAGADTGRAMATRDRDGRLRPGGSARKGGGVLARMSHPRASCCCPGGTPTPATGGGGRGHGCCFRHPTTALPQHTGRW